MLAEAQVYHLEKGVLVLVVEHQLKVGPATVVLEVAFINHRRQSLVVSVS